MNTEELIGERTAKWEKLDEMKKTCEKEKRDKTKEEIEEATKILDEIDELSEKISTEERIRKTGDFLKEPTSKPYLENIQGNPDGGGENRFKSMGDFMSAVVYAGKIVGQAAVGPVDKRLIEQRASGMSEGVPSDGGYLIQQDFAGKLVEVAHETGILSRKVKRMPISATANSLKGYGIDETSRKDGYRWGGIRCYWAAEAALKTKSDPKFRVMELSLQKLIGLVYLTDELIEDTTALEAWVTEGFREEIGFKLDCAIFEGTGVGQPLGIKSAGCTISVGKETNQTATTIKAENIEKMYARMFAGSLPRSEWLINQDCWPQIFQLSHSVGAGGVPMFIPAGGLSNAPFGSLLGRPITPIEQAETLGTVGDIMLVDMSKYITIDKGGIQQASSIHVRFLYDESILRFVYRVNGQPLYESAITPYKGDNTQSAFIKLASR